MYATTTTTSSTTSTTTTIASAVEFTTIVAVAGCVLLLIIIITLKYMKPIKEICKKEAKMLINPGIRAVWSVFTMHSFWDFAVSWPIDLVTVVL